MSEQIIETKSCKNCGIQYSITDADMEFYDKISPTFDGQKFQIPTPTHCPMCRMQRRLCFRNERKLYRRASEASGKSIISIYSKDKPYKVFEHNEWHSDRWDGLEYGKDFDFNKHFFEQFDKLMKDVPQIALLNCDNENCEYNNYIAGCKDCYLSAVVYYGAENIYYSNRVWYGNNILDSYNMKSCEHCFECMNLENCYKCLYLIHSNDCSNCNFSRHLKGCKHCFFCCNLSNQEYCILNKQYSKDEYFEIIANFDYSTHDGITNLIKKLNDFSKTQIFPDTNNTKCDNCIGDNLKTSKNAHYCFDNYNIEDSKYLLAGECKDSYDGIGGKLEKSYEFCRCGIGGMYYNFAFDCINSNYTYYSASIQNCNNCFGCVGIKNKEYCILNKQYTKEEYEKNVAKIIQHMQSSGEWGEFFPISLSPFAYNETVALDYFPLQKEKAITNGIKWKENENIDYDGEIYKAKHIDEYDSDKIGKENAEKNQKEAITGIIKCKISNRPFKLIKDELDFLIKNRLPIPNIHPDERHKIKMNKKNSITFNRVKCGKCNKETLTTYETGDGKDVYCEQCYEKEIY